MRFLAVAALLILSLMTASVYVLAIVLAIKLRTLSSSSSHQKVIDRASNVSVIVPCKGRHPRLKGNLRSILEQDYPRYEVIFVAQVGDSSLTCIEDLVEESETRTKVLSVEPRDHRSDKINNQLAGIKEIDKDSEIVVFFDSDGYALPGFLSNLVTPLYERNDIVTTSYRWFPWNEESAALAISMMCGALALLVQSSPWFTLPWGGAMAMTVDVFKSLQVRREWTGALYDDYVLGLLLRRARMKASFVPSALVMNPPLVSLRALYQEGRRHLHMMRVVLRKQWVFALCSVILVVFFPLVFLALVSRLEWLIAPPLGIGIALSMPILSTFIMHSVISSCEDLSRLSGYATARVPRKYLTLAFAIPNVLFVQFLGSTFGETVEWHNVTYEVKAYNRTRVIRQGRQVLG